MKRLFIVLLIAVFYYIVWPSYTTIGISTIALNQRSSYIHLFYPVKKQIACQHMQLLWDLPSFAYGDESLLRSNTKKYPLILISHGYKGDAFELFWLISSLVAAGYMVASVQHPERFLFNNSLNMVQPWQRACAISKAIDALLSCDLAPCIDQSKIGFIGHSMGGLTGLWLAGATANGITLKDIKEHMQEQLVAAGQLCMGASFMQKQIAQIMPFIDQINIEQAQESYCDSRIRAFFLISPVFGWLFGKHGFDQIHVPVKIVTFAQDPLVLAQQYLAPYVAHNSKIQLAYVPSSVDNHFAFLQNSRQLSHLFLPEFVWKDPVGCDRISIQKKVAHQALQFFEDIK